MDDLEIVRGAFFNRQELSVGRGDMNIHVRGCRGYDFDAVRWYNMKNGKKRGRRMCRNLFLIRLIRWCIF